MLAHELCYLGDYMCGEVLGIDMIIAQHAATYMGMNVIPLLGMLVLLFFKYTLDSQMTSFKMADEIS